MKPAPFEYLAARTRDEVVAALADGRTRVLAGGQSLLLAMNLRLVRPARVVDINRVGGFDRLEISGAALRVGPLVRHRAFETLTGAGALGRLLARVAPYVGHPPIRARGTLLGSLADANPAAEWPAVAVALDAQFDLVGPDGTRTVAAGEFFTGPFATVRRPEELLAEVRLPLLAAGTGVGFVEQRRTAASFADLGAVAALAVSGGTVTAARIALVNAADRAVRAPAAEAALLGAPATAASFAEAGHVAAGTDADPRSRPDADAGYRRHAVAVLVRRALSAALDDLAASGGAASRGDSPQPGHAPHAGVRPDPASGG